MAGSRFDGFGSLEDIGTGGSYWSSNVYSFIDSGSLIYESDRLLFNSSTSGMFGYSRAYGYSVRCIKE
jgi:hypothetical protein